MNDNINQKFDNGQIAELQKNIDLSDIPEIKDFSKGHFRYPEKVATIQRFLENSTFSYIDDDNFAWLKDSNRENYQKRINNILRWAHANGCPF